MKKSLRTVLGNLLYSYHPIDENEEDEFITLIHDAVKNCIPKHLYRYRGCSKNSIRAFRQDHVCAVPPSMFNDPYDCLLRYEKKEKQNDLSKEDFEKEVEHYQRTGKLSDSQEEHMPLKLIAHYKSLLDEYIAGKWNYEGSSNKDFDSEEFLHKHLISPSSHFLHKVTRISCFSERNDSILMWSHYAEEHKGYVIGYELSSNENKYILEDMYPVIYNNKRYDASEANRYLMGQIIKMRNNPFHGVLPFLAAAIFKSKDWSYEKEWRLVNFDNSEDIAKFYLKPSCIIYGSRIEQDDYEELHEIAISKGIKEYKAKIDNSSFIYKMKIERIKK